MSLCNTDSVMKNITLKEAYVILSNATAVIINENALVYPSLWELSGEEENEFLYLSWEDDGHDYSLKFTEGDNFTVKVKGCNLYLYDSDANDDDEITILTILAPKELN